MQHNTPFPDDQPLTESEIATCVAECVDKILALTEDPGEQEQIVNDIGDVLEGWNTSFPLIPHPVKRVVEEMISQKSHVAQQRDRGNGNGKRVNGGRG